MARWESSVPGDGKTYTSTEIAIGICKMIGADKIGFYDTETGSDWIIKKVQEAVKTISPQVPRI
jgi:hypothetical protein